MKQSELLVQRLAAEKKERLARERVDAKPAKMRYKKTLEFLDTVEFELLPIFNYCEEHDIEIHPTYSYGDIYYVFPWQLPLLQIMEDVYCGMPDRLCSKEPRDFITSQGSMGYKLFCKDNAFYTISFRCDATKEGSTCELVKTEETREVTKTETVRVYDVICNGQKSGEHFKPEEKGGD